LLADRALFERYGSGATRSTMTCSWSASGRSRAPWRAATNAPGSPSTISSRSPAWGSSKAINRFDVSRDVAFSSYAVPTILGEIRRYLRDRTWSVRVPRGLQELALRVDKHVVELILMSTNSSPISDVTIVDNLLAGGGYTLYCAATVPGVGGTEVVTGNRFARTYDQKGGYYGPAAYCGSGVDVWSGNVWDDTGLRIST
jgi:Sigma-70 region 2